MYKGKFYYFIIVLGLLFSCTKEKIVSVIDPCQGKADTTGLDLLWEKAFKNDGNIRLMKITGQGVFVIHNSLSSKTPAELSLFDAKTGAIKWQITYQEAYVFSKYVILDNYFYFAKTNKLFRLDLNTGQIETVFTNEAEHFITLIPNSLDQSIFLKSDYFDDISKTYSYQLVEFETESLKAKVIADTTLTESAKNQDFFKTPVFFKSNGTRILCYSFIDLDQETRKITALDIDTRTNLWNKIYFDAIFQTTNLVSDDTKIYLIRKDFLSAFDPITGQEYWKTWVYSSEGYVYFVNNSIFYVDGPQVLKIDKSTGILDWEKEIRLWSHVSPAYYKDQVYFIGQAALQACDFSGGCLTTTTLNPYFDDNGTRRFFTDLDIDSLNGIIVVADNYHLRGYKLPE